MITSQQYDTLKEFFRELFSDEHRAHVEKTTEVHHGYHAVTVCLKDPEQVSVYFGVERAP